MELIQDIGIVEQLLKIKDLSVYGILLTIIAILIFEIRSARKDIKEKEERINEVIDNHLEDLKQSNKDMFDAYKILNNLGNEIKDIVRGYK